MRAQVRGDPLEVVFTVELPIGLAAKFIGVGVCCGCLADDLEDDVCEHCRLDHGPILDAVEAG